MPDTKLPLGRVIIERATRRPIGPTAPISANDLPWKDIPHSEVLWRYMDLRKFKDLLQSSALYFARGDRFTDPFEGRFSSGNREKMSPSDQALRSIYKINDSLSDAERRADLTRKLCFVSCWHRNTQETSKMWASYTTTSNSIVLTTSAKALYKFTPDYLVKSAVKYHQDDFPRTEFTHSSLFFYKPAEYSFENEFRLLRSLQEGESLNFNNPTDEFRKIPVQLKKIVHRVITHPAATAAFKQEVDQMLVQYLRHIKREDSSLPC